VSQQPEVFGKCTLKETRRLSPHIGVRRFVDCGTGTFEENGITVDSVGCAALLLVRLDAIIGAI
jgi:hypothetical protein